MLQHADHRLGSGPDNAARVAAESWQANRSLLDALNAPLGGRAVAVAAYANHGRWVVECPDCRGAQLASPSDPRFMCNCCGNVAAGGAWRPVIWPKNRDAIEEQLAARPPENRNWSPGESLAQLRRENEAHMKAGA